MIKRHIRFMTRIGLPGWQTGGLAAQPGAGWFNGPSPVLRGAGDELVYG